MKRIILLFLWLSLVPSVSVRADEDPFAGFHKSLKDQAFVVETDEEMSAESLDRISGQYDLGFTLPEQEYESSSHGRSGPFGYSEFEEKTSQTY